MESFDAIVIGAGVIGSSVAYHLARLGAKKVLVLERLQIGAGTSTQSSGILRTHYSVIENVELARRSWSVFTNFAEYLQDEDAASGLADGQWLSGALRFEVSPVPEPASAGLALAGVALVALVAGRRRQPQPPAMRAPRSL